MIWKYTDEIAKFISDNVTGRTAKELAELTNNKFNTCFTASSMKSYKSNHDLKSGTRCGLPAGRPTELYPEEVKSFITMNHVGNGPKDMARILNAAFGTNYTSGQMKGYYSHNKFDSGLDGKFLKGNIPFNKGKPKYWIGGEDTQFKKGSTPHNYQPVGSERINTYGYHDIKIADPNKWKAKHILLWEEHKGPIKRGHILIFGDGDKNNVTLDNLIMVSRQQLLVLNRHNLIQKDADLTRTGIIIADIKTKISKRRR